MRMLNHKPIAKYAGLLVCFVEIHSKPSSGNKVIIHDDRH